MQTPRRTGTSGEEWACDPESGSRKSRWPPGSTPMLDSDAAEPLSGAKYCFRKPDVTFKLEEGEDPWLFEEECLIGATQIIKTISVLLVSEFSTNLQTSLIISDYCEGNLSTWESKSPTYKQAPFQECVVQYLEKYRSQYNRRHTGAGIE
eukprot:bmy_19499T0